MRRLLHPLLAGALLAGCAYTPRPAAPTAADYLVQYSKTGSFEEVREDLTLAIEGRGLVIDHTSHIHDMLERTGRDLGLTKAIYKDAEAYSFCSATISRAMMEADAHNIVFCPFVITVYATVTEPNKVYVAYRRPPQVGNDVSKAALKAVHDLLDGIAREAIGQ
jgi:uncharacterized protein (DUF302 family)